jgi:hypothetical protein
MKKLLIVSLILPTIWSCNKTIEVSPSTSLTMDKTIVPDYNFLATTAYDFVYPNSNQTFILPIELYLRPFEGVRDTTNFVLEYDSNKYGQLVILKDTLFPGDKIRIKYADFTKFRLVPTYYTVVSGEHSLSFSISTSGIRKSSTLKINAKN